MVPQILEANFTSDCNRACQYYPDYFNKVFTSLFLEDEAAQQSNEIVIVWHELHTDYVSSYICVNWFYVVV